MANIPITITQQDGVLTKTLKEDQITWSDYSGSINTDNTLYKLNLGDLYSNLIAKGNDGQLKYKYWDPVNKRWLQDDYVDINDAFGYNLVMTNDYPMYVAKDNELMNIPDFISTTCIIARFNKHIKLANFTSYRQLDTGNNNYDKIIFSGLTTFYKLSGSTWKRFFGLKIRNDAQGQHLCFGAIATNGSDIGTRFDTLQPYEIKVEVKYADTTVQDLETRVAILESEMSDVQANLKEINKTVKDLPAIVAAVSENVSKLYVAR